MRLHNLPDGILVVAKLHLIPPLHRLNGKSDGEHLSRWICHTEVTIQMVKHPLQLLILLLGKLTFLRSAQTASGL